MSEFQTALLIIVAFVAITSGSIGLILSMVDHRLNNLLQRINLISLFIFALSIAIFRNPIDCVLFTLGIWFIETSLTTIILIIMDIFKVGYHGRIEGFAFKSFLFSIVIFCSLKIIIYVLVTPDKPTPFFTSIESFFAPFSYYYQ